MPRQRRKLETRAFTKKWDTIVRALSDTVKVSEPRVHGNDPDEAVDGSDIPNFQAIWDTGATGTLISSRVVDDLNLVPIRPVTIETANGETDSEVYLIELWLGNGFILTGVPVVRGELKDIDVLIGMDVISLGDFAVTNKDDETWMSFSMPSKRHLDFQRWFTRP